MINRKDKKFYSPPVPGEFVELACDGAHNWSPALPAHYRIGHYRPHCQVCGERGDVVHFGAQNIQKI